MRNILKFGRFDIGKATGPSSFTIHSLVHMKLISKDKDLSKKAYTLDELRDLESKLVLICGDKADARTEVDHFLNVSYLCQSDSILDLSPGKYFPLWNRKGGNSFCFLIALFEKNEPKLKLIIRLYAVAA